MSKCITRRAPRRRRDVSHHSITVVLGVVVFAAGCARTESADSTAETLTALTAASPSTEVSVVSDPSASALSTTVTSAPGTGPVSGPTTGSISGPSSGSGAEQASIAPATPPPGASAATTAPFDTGREERYADEALRDYFEHLQAGDYEASYNMLAAKPAWAEYVDYWDVKVASFDVQLGECDDPFAETETTCGYDIFVVYSDAASADYANRCIGERTTIRLIAVPNDFRLGDQQRVRGLNCG